MVSAVNHPVIRMDHPSSPRPMAAKPETKSAKAVTRDVWNHSTVAAIGGAVATMALAGTYHRITTREFATVGATLVAPSAVVGGVAAAIVGKRTRSTPWALGAGALGGAVGVVGLQLLGGGRLYLPGMLIGAGVGFASSGAMIGLNRLISQFHK